MGRDIAGPRDSRAARGWRVPAAGAGGSGSAAASPAPASPPSPGSTNLPRPGGAERSGGPEPGALRREAAALGEPGAAAGPAPSREHKGAADKRRPLGSLNPSPGRADRGSDPGETNRRRGNAVWQLHPRQEGKLDRWARGGSDTSETRSRGWDTGHLL